MPLPLDQMRTDAAEALAFRDEHGPTIPFVAADCAYHVLALLDALAAAVRAGEGLARAAGHARDFIRGYRTPAGYANPHALQEAVGAAQDAWKAAKEEASRDL